MQLPADCHLPPALVQHPIPIHRVQKAGHVVLEPAGNLLFGVSHQIQKTGVHICDGEFPVIPAPQHCCGNPVAGVTRSVPPNGRLPLRCLRLRRIRLPAPDGQSPAIPRVLRTQPQDRIPIPDVLTGVFVPDPVPTGKLQRALRKKAVVGSVHLLSRFRLIIRVDTGPHKGLPRILHRFFLTKSGKVMVRLIEKVICSGVPIQFQYRCVQVTEQRKQLILALGRPGLLVHIGGPTDLILSTVVRRAQSVGVFPGQLKKFRLHTFEALQKVAGECAALTLQNHIVCFILGNRPLIHPVGGQRVKTIRHCHNLGINRDTVLPQPLGIAPAIPPLVVETADVVSVAQIFRVSHPVKARQYLTAPEGMGLHDLEFLRRQPAGFIQNGIRNGNLADVVEG
ncbi:hypothetical protein SDC9_86999 [bioreactor metagenome]|uniref:Uncharacterized protein n=1 Tax=bioreactor metagenome TaxID=1076179 RepID=A0A644ZHQ9_9ZZZZ